MNGYYFQVSTMVVCLICSCSTDLVILGEKGANGINRAAEKEAVLSVPTKDCIYILSVEEIIQIQHK